MAELTVMTWNVQNLFPPGTPDGPATEEEYSAKLAGLAGVIDDVGPDVLALQEVGDPSVLADLDDACVTPLGHRAVGVPDDRGIRVALLSGRKLSNHRDIRTFPTGLVPIQVADVGVDDPLTTTNEALSTTAGRGILSATVRAGGERVTILVCHLKSKLVSYTRPPGVPGSPFAPRDEAERYRYAGYALFRRTAEAMTARAALDAALAADDDAPSTGTGAGRTRPVVLVGDLNDEPQAATTQIIGGPGGSEIDFTRGSGFQSADRGDGYRMWNLHRLLPTDRPAYTRIFAGRGELIDHIFASHRLVNPGNLPRVEIVAASPLPSMDEDPDPRPPAPSDHAAVVATFTI